MKFLNNNKRIVRTLMCVLYVVDIAINILMNRISDESFDLLSTHNIVTLVVFAILILVHILIETLVFDPSPRRQRKKLAKAFEDNGVYDVAAMEISRCIQCHDFKSAKRIKKTMDFLEK